MGRAIKQSGAGTDVLATLCETVFLLGKGRGQRGRLLHCLYFVGLNLGPGDHFPSSKKGAGIDIPGCASAVGTVAVFDIPGCGCAVGTSAVLDIPGCASAVGTVAVNMLYWLCDILYLDPQER